MTSELPFEYLHGEMVAHLHALETSSSATADTATAATKLEHMGFRVGHSLVERMTKECPRFNSQLDIIKFICKEFWMCLFHKQVDNLKTNHQVRSSRRGACFSADAAPCLAGRLRGAGQLVQRAAIVCVDGGGRPTVRVPVRPPARRVDGAARALHRDGRHRAGARRSLLHPGAAASGVTSDEI